MMGTRLRKRIKSENGESIAEVLVALLIAAIALMMLASMISSTVSMVNKSKTKMDEYYNNNAVLELFQNSEAEETPLTIQLIQSPGTSAETVQETSKVDLYENKTFSKTVYAYQIAK